MDDPGPDKASKPASLKSAIRAARLDEAERAQAVGDLRGAEVARLQLLSEAIEPVLRQVPTEVDMFDAGIVAGGERPRLFIDMISFVEMDRDKRSYRFLQDTRHGRLVLADTESLGAMTEAVTKYIARRLVEREQALASLLGDGTLPRPPMPMPAPPPPPSAAPAPPVPPPPALQPMRSRGPIRRHTMRVLRICIDALGVLTLAGLFWLGLQYVQARFQLPW